MDVIALRNDFVIYCNSAMDCCNFEDYATLSFVAKLTIN